MHLIELDELDNSNGRYDFSALLSACIGVNRRPSAVKKSAPIAIKKPWAKALPTLRLLRFYLRLSAFICGLNDLPLLPSLSLRRKRYLGVAD
jgi:hypothetical protein